jgi:hypothetical protein
MKNHKTAFLNAAFIASLSFSGLAFGQDSPAFVTVADGGSETSSAVVVSVAKPTATDQKPLTERWLDLDTLSWAGRYRSSVNTNGRHMFDFGQDRYIASGKVKLDEQGKYTINFHASSGRYFNWAYADEVGGDYAQAVIAIRPYRTPAYVAAVTAALAADPDGATYKAGFPTRGGYFYLRQLYASATPIKEVTFEFGSLAIDHGQNSEITSFDDDGYISGERVRVQDPKHLFFDRVGATWAFIGNSLTPNFFARGGDLAHSNYAQYLVEKKLGKQVTASTDFTEIRGTHTWREGVSVRMPKGQVLDSVLVELYQRMNTINISGTDFGTGNGFAVSATKNILKRVEFTGGYDTVDRNYGVYSGSIYLAVTGFGWNGDVYANGRRGFAKANVKLGKGMTAFGFYQHMIPAFDPNTVAGYSSQLQGYNAGMNFDLKTMANMRRRVF